jgi:hypothetical protein
MHSSTDLSNEGKVVYLLTCKEESERKAKWQLWFGSSWYCKAKGVDPYPGGAVQPIVLSTEGSQTDYQILAQQTHQQFVLQAKGLEWEQEEVVQG